MNIKPLEVLTLLRVLFQRTCSRSDHCDQSR